MAAAAAARPRGRCAVRNAPAVGFSLGFVPPLMLLRGGNERGARDAGTYTRNGGRGGDRSGGLRGREAGAARSDARARPSAAAGSGASTAPAAAAGLAR